MCVTGFQQSSVSVSLTDGRIKLISGDISPYEFTRFRELGGFVRSVVPSSGCICESDTIKPSVWFYLSRIFGVGTSLFPHLHELHWFIEEPRDTELLLIASSSLRRLFVCYGGCDHSSPQKEWLLSQSMLFRSVFHDAAPGLTHLMIYDTGPVPLLPFCLSNIGFHHKLRMVALDQDESTSLHVLRTLSSVETLEELIIGVDSIDDVDFSGFPAITKLNVVCTPLSGPSSQVFEAFSSPHLRELNLCDRSDAANTDNLLATSTALARRFPRMSDLSLTLSSPLRNGASGTSLEAALAPLFPLPMATFSLTIQCSFVAPLSDGFFTALARSWQHLRELSIAISQQANNPSLYGAVTAQALLALARGCPQLQMLRLPSMRIPEEGEGGAYPVLRHPLHTLAVDRLVALQAPAVGPGSPNSVVGEDEYAEFGLLLDKLFPELDTRRVPSGDPPTDTWKRVLWGVRLCQMGRLNRGSS